MICLSASVSEINGSSEMTGDAGSSGTDTVADVAGGVGLTTGAATLLRREIFLIEFVKLFSFLIKVPFLTRFQTQESINYEYFSIFS